jgi:hypothetical protein
VDITGIVFFGPRRSADIASVGCTDIGLVGGSQRDASVVAGARAVLVSRSYHLDAGYRRAQIPAEALFGRRPIAAVVLGPHPPGFV